MAKIYIEIDKIGVPKIKAEGFAGSSCTDATKPILDALTGGDENLAKIEDTEELYNTNTDETLEMEGL